MASTVSMADVKLDDSESETSLERKKRFSGALPPSHPNFQRDKYTKDEFIELLLFEIKELQSGLSSKDAQISQLLQSRKPSDASFNISSEKRLENAIDDVPQRSARRKLESSQHCDTTKSTTENLKRESIASITSNGPIDVGGGVPLSSAFRYELTAALGDKDSPIRSHSPQPEHVDITIKTEPTPYALEGLRLERFSNNEIPSSYQIEQTSRNENIEGKTERTEVEDIFTKTVAPVNSYQSRIRLPGTLKQPETRKCPENLQKNDYIVTDIQLQSRTPQEELSEPRSNTDPILSHTPDGFNQGNGTLFTRSETSDLQSHLSSLTNSPPLSSITPTKNFNFDALNTPDTQRFTSTDSFHGSQSISSQTPGSSFHVLSTSKTEDDVDLLIKPEEFQTIRINVVSTITMNPKKLDDYNCTFSINDNESTKEMWRIRKSYSKLYILDNEIRPVIEFFGLPPLPEKSLFGSTTPLKVDARRLSLQDYFNTIFVMPHIPRLVLILLCRFLSLNFVNPLDDFRTGSRKEGFLIRRYKGLGTTWKVRWCQVDGPALEIYDSPGGSLLEQIKLSGSQIGRQSSDSVAEERGYRHAFLILENTKSSKLSSSPPKHFFCAETDSERDEWVTAMVEFAEGDAPSNQEEQHTVPETDLGRGRDAGHNDTDSSSRHVSGASSNNGQLSIDAENGLPTYTDESLKDTKKTRKKSRFPFMNRSSVHSDVVQNQQENQNPTIPPSTELPMLAYLDQMTLSDEPAKAIFGRDLEEVFELSNNLFNGRRIPSVCYRCLDFLSKTGAIYEEGIFRLSGSASSIRQLKDKFNTDYDVDIFESNLHPDMHTVAGLLKTYLRELPDPIFGREAYSELQQLVTESGAPNSSTVIRMRDLIRNTRHVNKIHYDFCISIFGFLRLVIAKNSINKMNLKNVCIVFVPTLNMSTDILSACLTDFDCIFGNADPIPDSNRQVLDLQIPIF